jgi:regulator of protease activity HflC (stomatin/prohibitin superfamily)
MMNIHIDPAYVNDLYQKEGLDFADKVIDPAFNDFIKEVVPTYPIGEILPKREEIRQRAMKKLRDNLSRYHIIADDIYFANIRFSPAYEGAIEAKQVAQQQVLGQREIEAQQKVATAKGGHSQRRGQVDPGGGSGTGERKPMMPFHGRSARSPCSTKVKKGDTNRSGFSRLICGRKPL